MAIAFFCLVISFPSSAYLDVISNLPLRSGFSRGAYQVRALAGMIEKVIRTLAYYYYVFTHVPLKVGLLRKGNEEQIPL